MNKNWIAEELILPGVEALQTQAEPVVPIIKLRASYGESECPRPPLAWRVQGREVYRALFARYGANVVSTEEAVAYIMQLQFGDKRLSHQVAQNKLQDMIRAPWFPVVRVGGEVARRSYVRFLSHIMGEGEILTYGLLPNGMVSEKLASDRTRDLASDPRHTMVAES